MQHCTCFFFRSNFFACFCILIIFIYFHFSPLALHHTRINIASCKNAFKPPNDCDYPYWDYVFNCAAETRLGKCDAVYQEGIYKLSMNCINEAIAQQVYRYIEFSSANMLSSDKKPTNEQCEKKPWTKLAQQKARVEEELENRTNELNYTILRLPLVYGTGDHKGLGKFLSLFVVACARERACVQSEISNTFD